MVGLPLTLRGSAGAQAQETAAFVASLEALLDVPVESFDERFTTALAAVRAVLAGPGGRARRRAPARELAGVDEPRGRNAARSPAGPRRAAAEGPDRSPPRDRRRSCSSPSSGSRSGSASARSGTATPRSRRPRRRSPHRSRRSSAIVFPEGFTRKQMVVRVAEVRQIAKTKRNVTPTLSGNTYAKASKTAPVPPTFRKDAKGRSRASSSRRPTSSRRRRRARSWSTTRSTTSRRTGRRSTSPRRRRRT